MNANEIKDIFINNDFELCEEYSNSDGFNYFFIKKDFNVEVFYNFQDNELDLMLERPFYGKSESIKSSNLKECLDLCQNFIEFVNEIIVKESTMKNLTKNDCELFLKTGSYDGMATGVIEYQNHLYYIENITHTYHKFKSKEDSANNVWRNFYIFELSKEELEQIVLTSLDWMRHINLSTLCKNWTSLNTSICEDKVEHDKHFNGKYRHKLNISKEPIMKLTLFYK